MTKIKNSLRCAIYTRKSTEEGLDQAFNSLQAQREACEAYIKSQAHEGWTLVKTVFDDGGYSGGSMDRPALKLLLEGVRLGQINVIVVYKVDRLTRSLADFAKIVEILDEASASFVSITQSFNTTTSMGRLTLNVLLSFAQFEREVTGERIRDKIAASKRKGLWMGGNPPLGYDVLNRQLVINEPEAEQIRYIFRQYLETGSALDVVDELVAKGVRSKTWTSMSGRKIGGHRIVLGAIYHILRNHAYVGQIAHKGNIYAGEHSPIIDRDTWARTQSKLDENRVQTVGTIQTRSQAPLAALLYDDRGNLMGSSYTTKSGGRRYPYYVSRALTERRTDEAGSIPRVPAHAVERLVVDQLLAHVKDAKTLSRQIANDGLVATIRQHIVRITLHARSVEIIRRHLEKPDSANNTIEETHTINVPIRMKFRGGERTIISADDKDSAPRPNPGLVRSIVRAGQWRKLMEAGAARSVEEIARQNKCTKSYARFMLEISFLAPAIVERVLSAQQPRTLTVRRLFEQGIPLSWREQRRTFDT